MVAEWSQKAISQSGGKIGSAMVYEPTWKTCLWMEHAEKIHKNVEQLIYHLLQVAYIFLQPCQSHLTCYLARAFISLFPWQGYYLHYLRPLFSSEDFYI